MLDHPISFDTPHGVEDKVPATFACTGTDARDPGRVYLSEVHLSPSLTLDRPQVVAWLGAAEVERLDAIGADAWADTPAREFA